MAPFRIFSKYGTYSRASRYLRDFAYWPFIVCTWLPGLIFFRGHVGEISSINGESMYPSLNTDFNTSLKKDFCWIKKWDPTGQLERGMVVSLRNPLNPEILQVKRIVALEGDVVFTRPPCPLAELRIPRNHVWVEGDNKDATKTRDSNTYGPIPLNLIQGKVTHILLPLERCGRVPQLERRKNSRVLVGCKDNAPGWFDEA